MLTLFVGKAKDGQFVIEEAYFDKGGLKMLTSFSGPDDVDWAATLKEVEDSVGDSSYRSSYYLNVASDEDVKKIIGVPVEDFINNYKSKFINV